MWEPSWWTLRGPCRRVAMAWRVGPAGVEEQGKSTIGVAQERRRPGRFHPESGRGNRSEERKPPALGVARHADGSEASVHRLVPPSEGDEVRRDERPGVVAP